MRPAQDALRRNAVESDSATETAMESLWTSKPMWIITFMCRSRLQLTEAD
ncbi:MAG: hypothetical protein ABIV39_04285 [Verrucomicrobiota bacterium]